MEVINKDHKEYERFVPAQPTIKLGEVRLHIPKSVARMYDWEPGMYLHFTVDLDRLYFYVNKNRAGIRLHLNTNGTYMGSCRIVKQILNKKLPRVRWHDGKFNFRQSNRQYEGNQLFEILIHNKIKQK